MNSHLFLNVAAFAFCAAASAQVQLSGIAPPVNPQQEQQCAEHSQEWYAQIRRAEEANNQCQRRDGGTVKASGVWMPNCRSSQQAYITCAPIADQICFLRAQQEASVSSCYRQLAANRNAERDRQSTLRRLEYQKEQLESAFRTATELREKGVANTVIDHYTRTPADAASDLHGHIREAARTTGTTAADSQPTLNRVGAASESLFRVMPINPIAIELGSQSAAAARARMGDALNQLDGATTRANVELSVPVRSGGSGEVENARSRLQGATQALGGGSSGTHTTPVHAMRDEVSPSEEDVIDALSEEQLRLQINQTLQQSMQQLQATINANSPSNRAAADRRQEPRSPPTRPSGGCTTRYANGACHQELVGPKRR